LNDPIVILFDEGTMSTYTTTISIAKEVINALNTEISKHGKLTLRGYKNIIRMFLGPNSFNEPFILDDAVGFVSTGDQTFKLTDLVLHEQGKYTGELLCLHAAVYNAAE